MSLSCTVGAADCCTPLGSDNSPIAVPTRREARWVLQRTSSAVPSMDASKVSLPSMSASVRIMLPPVAFAMRLPGRQRGPSQPRRPPAT